jgi:hypothetical protein
MPEEPAVGDERSARNGAWKDRRSPRRSRRVLGSFYIVGWLLWTWGVYVWADSHGHQDWLKGNRPIFAVVAALTFWPPDVLSWYLAHPADHRRMPWDDGG